MELQADSGAFSKDLAQARDAAVTLATENDFGRPAIMSALREHTNVWDTSVFKNPRPDTAPQRLRTLAAQIREICALSTTLVRCGMKPVLWENLGRSNSDLESDIDARETVLMAETSVLIVQIVPGKREQPAGHLSRDESGDAAFIRRRLHEAGVEHGSVGVAAFIPFEPRDNMWGTVTFDGRESTNKNPPTLVQRLFGAYFRQMLTALPKLHTIIVMSAPIANTIRRLPEIAAHTPNMIYNYVCDSAKAAGKGAAARDRLPAWPVYTTLENMRITRAQSVTALRFDHPYTITGASTKPAVAKEKLDNMRKCCKDIAISLASWLLRRSGDVKTSVYEVQSPFSRAMTAGKRTEDADAALRRAAEEHKAELENEASTSDDAEEPADEFDFMAMAKPTKKEIRAADKAKRKRLGVDESDAERAARIKRLRALAEEHDSAPRHGRHYFFGGRAVFGVPPATMTDVADLKNRGVELLVCLDSVRVVLPAGSKKMATFDTRIQGTDRYKHGNTVSRFTPAMIYDILDKAAPVWAEGKAVYFYEMAPGEATHLLVAALHAWFHPDLLKPDNERFVRSKYGAEAVIPEKQLTDFVLQLSEGAPMRWGTESDPSSVCKFVAWLYSPETDAHQRLARFGTQVQAMFFAEYVRNTIMDSAMREAAVDTSVAVPHSATGIHAYWTAQDEDIYRIVDASVIAGDDEASGDDELVPLTRFCELNEAERWMAQFKTRPGATIAKYARSDFDAGDVGFIGLDNWRTLRDTLAENAA